MAKKMKILDWIAIVFLIVGGLNWGLVGAFDFNLVSWMFSGIAIIERAVYSVVGIAAIYSIYVFAKR